jgi:PAS domain S-box-containing protein
VLTSIENIELAGEACTITTMLDITERKQAEEQFRLVVEASPNAIILVDLAGSISLVNKRAESLFGYTRQELMGQPVEMLVPQQFRTHHSDYRATFFGSPSARPMGAGRDLFGLRKDGSQVPVEIGLNPITTVEGNFVLASIIDITERKRAEAEISDLLQREKAARVETRKLNEELEQRVMERTADLQAANKELESFSYSVSHDLRAPLRSIDGFSQALMEDYRSELDDVAQNYLQRVRTGSQHMAQLIDDLLTLSRVSRAEMRRDTIQLSELAESIADDLHRSDPSRQVTFAITPGLTILADRQLMRSVLENLLGNAWKFTGNCSAARIELAFLLQPDGQQVYYVRDNGAGFDMAYADKLFGAFQRLHSPAEFPGTGIGLASVQRIIHRHGGRIWAEGAVGQGATLYFTVESDQPSS